MTFYYYAAARPNSVVLNDEGMSLLMDWLLPSSANTLENLRIFFFSTNITKTPLQWASFKNLKLLTFFQNYDNTNMAISAGSIVSKNPIERIDFSRSQVASVEEGAFQGKFAYSLHLLHLIMFRVHDKII